MKFAKRVFLLSGIYGLLILFPLYFLEDWVGQDAPPALNHPEFYYGFIGIGLAWQIAFLIIAGNPLKHRALMIPAILEKFSFVGALAVLLMQGRVPSFQALYLGVDLLLGILFCMAYYRTSGISEFNSSGPGIRI